MSKTNQTAWSIGSNWTLLILNVGLSFFLSPFVVNKLGSTYHGIWAIALQFTGYLYLMDFGVRESVIRYTSKYVARGQGKQLSAILNTSLILYLPITLGCVGLTALCAWGVPKWFGISAEYAREASLAVTFVGLTITQTFIFNVFTGVLQGLNRFGIANATGMVITVLRATLIVLALSFGYKLVALAMIQFAMAVLGGIAGMVFAMRLLRDANLPFKLQRPRRRRLVALGRKVFGYGFYVLVNNVAQKINFASDAVVIGIFLPVSMVTPYAIAGSLIDYLRSLVISTAQVFSPLSSRLHTQRRPDELAKLLLSGAKLTVIITVPIALTYVILGREFVALWMGEQYRNSAGDVLLVLGVTQILSAPHYVVSSVLYGMSKHRAMGLLRVGEAALNLTLSILLVQRMGIIGVALGTAIAHSIVVLGFLPTMISRQIGLPITRYFLGSYARPLLAALPFLAGALWLAKYQPASSLAQFFLHIGLLCAVYAPVVYAVALNPDERQMIHRLVSKNRAPAAAA